MSREEKYDQKSMSVESLAILDLIKQIGDLTKQVIDSYQDPTQTHALEHRLSRLQDVLVSGLLEDGEKLSDAYHTCALDLLSRVLRDIPTSLQQQSSRGTFSSQRSQQTLFFQVIYWALLRPWLSPTIKGAVSSYHELEQYLKDLRQRPGRAEDAKWFDDFNSRIQVDIALRYVWESCLQALQSLPRLDGWKRNAQIFQALIQSSVHLPALPDLTPTEIKTAWGLMEKAASIGSNIYDYMIGHPNPQLHLPIINIQVTTYYALRGQLQLPPLHLALSYASGKCRYSGP